MRIFYKTNIVYNLSHLNICYPGTYVKILLELATDAAQNTEIKLFYRRMKGNLCQILVK